MVGGVFLNQDRPLVAVSPRQWFEEAEIGGGVEDRVPAIVETGTPAFDGTENLDALALSGNRHFRRVTHAAPGGVQRGILPEAGFVG